MQRGQRTHWLTANIRALRAYHLYLTKINWLVIMRLNGKTDMPKQKTKTTFIGIKLTAEEATLLKKLQSGLNSTTKTRVLLKGLDLMDKLYLSGSASSNIELTEKDEMSFPIATNLELARLEYEARQYSIKVQQARSKAKEVMRQVAQELSKTDEIVDKYKGDKSKLIQLLLELQHKNSWLSEESLKWVSQKLDVPLTQIYHIATSYKEFSLVPKGRHAITVCMGTSCEVRDTRQLLDGVIKTLKIKPGETSGDMRFSLGTVKCLGCCALGPVMVVDGKYYSKPSLKEIEEITAALD